MRQCLRSRVWGGRVENTFCSCSDTEGASRRQWLRLTFRLIVFNSAKRYKSMKYSWQNKHAPFRRPSIVDACKTKKRFTVVIHKTDDSMDFLRLVFISFSQNKRIARLTSERVSKPSVFSFPFQCSAISQLLVGNQSWSRRKMKPRQFVVIDVWLNVVKRLAWAWMASLSLRRQFN